MTDIINEASYDAVMDGTVEPYLESVMTEGSFSGYGGVELKFRSYRAQDPERTVVILHGFTEGMPKFDELIWYFLGSGSNVFIYDQRGHGRSYRPVSDLTLTHVDRFGDYVADFELFVDTVVPKDLPLCLFAHSMGGAVAGLYIEKHPDVFSKAVLSSPMIAPSTGAYPAFVGRLICRVMILFGGAKKRIFLSPEYPGEEKFESSCASSRARFDRYERFKRTHPEYQNYSPTYRWTLESLSVTKKLMKRGEPEKIRTDVLLLSAELDDIVLIPAQKAFASRIPSCRVEDMPGTKHEIYRGTDETVEKLVGVTLGFFEKAGK